MITQYIFVVNLYGGGNVRKQFTCETIEEYHEALRGMYHEAIQKYPFYVWKIKYKNNEVHKMGA